MKIINKEYNISSKLNKKIVLISDIHYYNKKDIICLNKVLDNIKSIDPNYICITGDIMDNANIADFDLLIEWLIKLSNITIVFMVLGNHEYYNVNHTYKLNDNYINKIKRINNLYFLNNKNIIMDGINFVGINLPIKHYMCNNENEDEFKKHIKKIKISNKHYNILLCHSPINLVKKKIIDKINIDLALCGHMHGGIVPRLLRPIFKTNGLINPKKKLFPKNAYGRIQIGNKNVIITSGVKVISQSHFLLLKNVFSPEIVIINL